jgi:hypothetical protein
VELKIEDQMLTIALLPSALIIYCCFKRLTTVQNLHLQFFKIIFAMGRGRQSPGLFNWAGSVFSIEIIV